MHLRSLIIAEGTTLDIYKHQCGKTSLVLFGGEINFVTATAPVDIGCSLTKLG